MKIDIQQHDLVPKNDPVVKELAKSHNISAGDVLKITRNSKTAGEFISYRIIIEG